MYQATFYRTCLATGSTRIRNQRPPQESRKGTNHNVSNIEASRNVNEIGPEKWVTMRGKDRLSGDARMLGGCMRRAPSADNEEDRHRKSTVQETHRIPATVMQCLKGLGLVLSGIERALEDKRRAWRSGGKWKCWGDRIGLGRTRDSLGPIT